MSPLQQKRILILGGSGFIGSHLAERLVSENAQVSILCRDPHDMRNTPAFFGTSLVPGEITRYEDVEKLTRNQDIVINLATVVCSTQKLHPYVDLEVNCKGQINVLEALRNNNPSARYIYPGSSMQFGRVPIKDLPVAEDYVQSPISMYAVHKQTAENYCKVYKRAYGLSSVVVRFPPIYGPSITGKKTRSIIELFIKKSLAGESFQVNGFGEDLKDFIYIDDVVDALVCVIKSSIREGTYHIGSGTSIKLAEVARLIVEECKTGNYELVPFPQELANFEVGSFYFDISKIRAELGWEPRIDIREGIKKMVDFYRNEAENR